MILDRLVVPGIVVALALAGCARVPLGATTPGAEGTVTCEYRPGGTPARAVDPPTTSEVPATGTATVTIDLGDSVLTAQLDRAAAPCTVNSFESLAAQGFYNDTECHRLSTSGIFILQCGDPTGTGRGGPGYTFDDELTPETAYRAGTLAMANSGRDTNGSQFFLVFADTPLPPNYTVFGHMDAQSTQAVADRAFQGHDASYPDGTGRPNLPTVIRSVVSG
ncbi:MAG: peptidylprolyl isomerase [Actinomycetes bacterium]